MAHSVAKRLRILGLYSAMQIILLTYLLTNLLTQTQLYIQTTLMSWIIAIPNFTRTVSVKLRTGLISGL